mgnify:FL=1
MAKTPTTQEIKQLADSCIKLYADRIEQARRAKNTSVLQTARYLGLWKSVVKKGCRWDALTNTERTEIVEALSNKGDDRAANTR